jgi:putative transposase
MRRTGVYHHLVYHFIWATKRRLPLITPERELGYALHAVGGVEDHIHVLVSLTPGTLVADVAKNLKGASSHYINRESGLDTTLYWQDGYGVVTLRDSEIPRVARYIKNQKEHHCGGKLSDALERLQG